MNVALNPIPPIQKKRNNFVRNKKNKVVVSSPQDVIVVHYPPEVMERNQVLATARTSLRNMGIEGLHQTPCFKTLLQNLPLILLEQYQAEKVGFYLFYLLNINKEDLNCVQKDIFPQFPQSRPR